MTKQALDLIIVEDEALYRNLLMVALCDDSVQVVGAYADGESALLACRSMQPDVAMLDIELAGSMNGIQVGLALRQLHPHIGIVLLSNHQDPAFLSAVPKASVAGWSYLLKKSVSDLSALRRAITGAASGLVVLDSQLVAGARPRHGSSVDRLTPRQKEILSLIAQGYSNTAIAERLVLAAKSVENHINQLYQQLDIDTSDPQVQPRVTAVLRYLEQTR